MILTGLEIKRQVALGNIKISDFNENQLGPNSYNLRLAPELMVYKEAILDPKRENRTATATIPESGLVLRPGHLYLARTMEYTETHGFVPMLEGRSSVGRYGLFIHVAAGFGYVGFAGNWTLELSCIHPIVLYPGMEICQIYYHTILGDVQEYHGKYQHSHDVIASRLYQEMNTNQEEL